MGEELGVPLAVRLADRDTELAGSAAVLPVLVVLGDYVLSLDQAMQLIAGVASYSLQ